MPKPPHSSNEKRFRKTYFQNKKKKFDKKRKTNRDDFEKKIKEIISETVSTLIEKEDQSVSKAKSSIGAVSTSSSLTKNNILKSTNKKGSISFINMRQLMYHIK